MKRDGIPTIRSRLVLVVVACLVPACLLALLLVSHNYQHERARQVHDAIATARALMSVVDRDLGSVESALSALATSPNAQAADLSAFYLETKALLRDRGGNRILLVDRNGQQHFNTMLPFGRAPDKRADPAMWRNLFEKGQPVVSDLFIGPLTGQPLVAIGVPVQSGGKVIYNLSEGILPERVSGILSRQRLPPQWIVSVFDSGGTIVARTHEMGRFLGKKGSPALVQRMREASEDSLETISVEGIPLVSVFSRSSVSNWTVAIGIPRASLYRELWQSIWWLFLAVLALLACSLTLAWAIGGRIAAAIGQLTGPATALGFGQPVALAPLRVKEADEVGKALTRASEMLLSAQYDASHDALTGLANRVLFDGVVEQQLAACQRTGTQLAILYIDLDGFKGVNDAHGHASGDALLCEVATRLKAGMRASDLVARLGGDEFAALLVHAGVDAAAAVAGKLVESLSRPYVLGALTVKISASIGVAEYPDAGTTVESLVLHADQAMYRAKVGGGHGHVIAGRQP